MMPFFFSFTYFQLQHRQLCLGLIFVYISIYILRALIALCTVYSCYASHCRQMFFNIKVSCFFFPNMICQVLIFTVHPKGAQWEWVFSSSIYYKNIVFYWFHHSYAYNLFKVIFLWTTHWKCTRIWILFLLDYMLLVGELLFCWKFFCDVAVIVYMSLKLLLWWPSVKKKSLFILSSTLSFHFSWLIPLHPWPLCQTRS